MRYTENKQEPGRVAHDFNSNIGKAQGDTEAGRSFCELKVSLIYVWTSEPAGAIYIVRHCLKKLKK